MIIPRVSYREYALRINIKWTVFSLHFFASHRRRTNNKNTFHIAFDHQFYGAFSLSLFWSVCSFCNWFQVLETISLNLRSKWKKKNTKSNNYLKTSVKKRYKTMKIKKLFFFFLFRIVWSSFLFLNSNAILHRWWEQTVTFSFHLISSPFFFMWTIK